MNTDWLFPWTAFPKAWDETKNHASAEGKNKHESIFSGFGKFGDPVGMTLWPKLSTYVNTRIPKKANELLGGVTKFTDDYSPHHALINAGIIKGDAAKASDKVSGFAINKPADTLAAVLGMIFGGGALFGGAGAGAAGGGAAGGGAAAGAGAGSGAGAASAAGPWASGYVLPAGSEFGAAGSGFGTLGSLVPGGSGAALGSAAGAAGTAVGSAAPAAGSAAPAAGMSPYGPYASGYQFAPGSQASLANVAPTGATNGGIFSDLDWKDPNTYQKLAKMMPQKGQDRQPEPVMPRGPGGVIFPEAW
jgi:hypothetical protein